MIGDPEDAICDAVNDYNIDLLVVGSHGLGAHNRSVSNIIACNRFFRPGEKSNLHDFMIFRGNCHFSCDI